MPKEGDTYTAIKVNLDKCLADWIKQNKIEFNKDVARILQVDPGRISDILAGRRNTTTYATLICDRLLSGNYSKLKEYAMDTEGVSQVDELELNNMIARLPEIEKENSRKIIRLCLDLLKAGKAGKAVKLLESELVK